MILRIAPSNLKGNLVVQPSKSDAHRKILCSAFAGGRSVVDNIIISEDMEATLRGIAEAGAVVSIGDSCTFADRKQLGITGTGGRIPDALSVDCGESGSTLRFLSMIFPAAGCNAVLTGRGRLPVRPMEGALRLFEEKDVRYDIPGDGIYLPMSIRGELKGPEYHIDSSVTSQFLTGLMIGLPAFGKSGTIFADGNFESKGYVNVTMSVLNKFGIYPTGDNPYKIPENSGLSAASTAVEGDWSNASYFYIMNALGADINISGLDEESRQPDSAIISHIEVITDPAKPISGGNVIDISECPDIMPTLAVLAAASEGKTTLTGGRRLRAKESDRIASVTAGLKAVGAECEEIDDGVVITGGKIRGGTVDSFGDHRIAMAFASLCTVSEGDIIIRGAECVKKSYPGFFEDLSSVGGNIV